MKVPAQAYSWERASMSMGTNRNTAPVEGRHHRGESRKEVTRG